MKRFVGFAVAGLLLAGCAREEDSGYVTGSGSSTDAGASQTAVNEVPSTTGGSTRLNSVVATNAGPETGVGASATASSGVGTATASGSAAVETEAAKAKDQVPQPPLPEDRTPRNDRTDR